MVGAMSESHGEQAAGTARAAATRFHPRMLMIFGIFFTVVLLVDASVHLYLASRLLLPLQLPPLAHNAGIVAVVLAAVLMIAGPFSQRLASHGVARILAWPSYVWMGFLWLAFVGAALSDLALWIAGLAGLLPTDDPFAMTALARLRSVIVLAVAAGLLAVGMRAALTPPRVRRVELRLPGWPASVDGYELVQLSDLHLGTLLRGAFSRGVVERVNALGADAVAITGDLVDGSVPDLRAAVKPLGELQSRDGTFFVTGNHDYYSGADPWIEEVRRLGISPLRNERIPLGGDGGFDLAGVDDRQGRTFGPGHGEDLARALAGRDPDRPVVLLAHQPLAFPRAAESGVALMLSGHTHGGQIAPFSWLTRLVYSRYVAGLYRKGESQLYVSRGTGFWGPPVRLLAPAEITLFVLRS